jgi:hypothetical protein
LVTRVDLGRLLLSWWYRGDRMLVGADLGRSLVLIAEHVAYGRGRFADGATLGLPDWGKLTEDAHGRRRWHANTGCPTVRLAALGDHSIWVGFGPARQPYPGPLPAVDGTPKRKIGEDERWGRLAGAARVVELCAAANTFDGYATRELGPHLQAFGLAEIEARPVHQDVEGAEHVLALLEAQHGLFVALDTEAPEWGTTLEGLHSGGTLAARLLGGFGLRAPLEHAARDLPEEEHAAWLRCFHGGWIE